MNDFLKKFADCFNYTDATLITPACEYKQLPEWGSMMALIVTAMIDSEYSKTITAEDLRATRTVADLFTLVQSK